MPVAKKKPAAKKKAPAKKAASASAPAKKKAAEKPAKAPTPVKSKATAKKKPAAKQSASAPASLEGFKGFEPYQEKKGEEYMNEAQRAHFRAILQAWKRELMEEVDRTLLHLQEEANNFPDPNDRASQESDFTMELRTRDRERKLIKKIDEAISAIDDNEYGYCESCGIEIGIRRLEARPTATLCIDCKTLDEIREKQRSS